MGVFFQTVECGCSIMRDDDGTVSGRYVCNDAGCQARLAVQESLTLPSDLESWIREEIRYTSASNLFRAIVKEITQGNWIIQSSDDDSEDEDDRVHELMVTIPSFRFQCSLTENERKDITQRFPHK